MKHLMTLMALVVAVTAGAQGTSIHEYPWNPDSNNDNLIGVADLLDFLPVFGDEFGLPPEPCDYDGTTTEDFIFSLMDGTIILDSIFIEYEIQDVASYYVQGCPDPVTDTVVFAGYSMLTSVWQSTNINFGAAQSSASTSNHDIVINCQYMSTTGEYEFSMQNYTLYSSGLLADGFFGGNWGGGSYNNIPFDDSWSFDENGIIIDNWNGWANDYYTNYLHILPYWHYAE